MILTKELLIKLKACKQGIDFCERNKLFGFDLKRLHEVDGDYNHFINWLTKKINNCYKINEDGQYYYVGYESEYDYIRTYSDDGRLLKSQHKSGYFSEYIYDERKNLIKIISNGDVRSYMEYDSNNNLINEVHKNYSMRSFYDTNNRCIRRECTFFDSDDVDWDIYEFDSFGNIVYSECSNGEWVKYNYDDHNNVIVSYDNYTPNGVYHDVQYYDNGQLKKYDSLKVPLIDYDYCS